MVKVWQKDNRIFIAGIVLNHHFGPVRAILEEAGRNNQRLIIDLSELEYIDQTGTMELLGLLEKMQNTGNRIELSNAREKVLTSFLQLSAQLWFKENIFSKAG